MAERNATLRYVETCVAKYPIILRVLLGRDFLPFALVDSCFHPQGRPVLRT